MTEVKVKLPRNLKHGILVWINASNQKVYYSSRRFDTAEFNDHDSNYYGEIEDIFPKNNRDRSSVVGLLEESDRVYGLCLNEQNGKSTEEVKVVFFTTWDKLLHFATDYFAKFDQLEEKRKKEETRRKKARNEWLERGRRFMKSNNATS